MIFADSNKLGEKIFHTERDSTYRKDRQKMGKIPRGEDVFPALFPTGVTTEPVMYPTCFLLYSSDHPITLEKPETSLHEWPLLCEA